jgi:hypothetical protein
MDRFDQKYIEHTAPEGRISARKMNHYNNSAVINGFSD